jgi:hypothetical protein
MSNVISILLGVFILCVIAFIGCVIYVAIGDDNDGWDY